MESCGQWGEVGLHDGLVAFTILCTFLPCGPISFCWFTLREAVFKSMTVTMGTRPSVHDEMCCGTKFANRPILSGANREPNPSM